MMFKQIYLSIHRKGLMALSLGIGLLPTLAFLLAVQPARAAGVVGSGTPESCTEAAFAAAFSTPGLVTFDCGPGPITITLSARYNVPVQATVDGGNLVTLDSNTSGGMFLIENTDEFTLTNITLTGGRHHDHGAIENFGTFTALNATFKEMNANPGATSHSPFLWNLGTAVLRDSVVRDSVNFDDAGGPTQVIYNAAGAGPNASLRVENSQFIANYGGAIRSEFAGQVTVVNSTFQENYGRHSGIFTSYSSMDGWAVITGSLFLDNDATFTGGMGAAVAHYNLGRVTITNTQFISNTASSFGGAIFMANPGDLAIVDSTFLTNTSILGGAIYHESGGTLTITGGAFSGNSSTSSGGAVFISSAPAVISGTTFISNTAVVDGGGAIIGNLTSLTLHNSQFSGNTAGGNGGAIFHDRLSLDVYNTFFENNVGDHGGAIYINGFPGGASLTLAHSVLINNQATDANGSGGGLYLGTTSYQINETVFANNQANNQGGGFKSSPFNTSGTIDNSTFSGNSAGVSGGNLHHDTGTLSITNTTFVGGPGGNLAPVGGMVHAVNTIVSGGGNCSAPLISQGHNLENGDTCGFNQSGDLPNTDPLLGPLQDNGGNTLTHLPSVNSPALENGDAAACPATDQRGVSRPQNAHCDMGAVEVEPNQAPLAAAGPDQSANVGEIVTLDGSGSSDPDGNYPLVYQWTQTGGPVVTLNEANTASPTFTVPVSGVFTFQLVVTDNLGLASTPDTAVVTGVEVPSKALYVYLPVLMKP